MDKRSFLKKAPILGVLPFFYPEIEDLSAEDIESKPSTGQDFWEEVRGQYALTSDFINLESGYYNIVPSPTLEKLKTHMTYVNTRGAYYMRTEQEKDRKTTARALSDFLGVDPRTAILTRNTTESLDLVISGYPWQAGDHVIYAEQDYGAMQAMFKQVVLRHSLRQDIVSIPNHPKNDDEIVGIYESKITPQTKMLMVCHMINTTGQILPIEKICTMAHRYGVEVLVDGAHCIGHFDFKISELGCDYYGSSLHKWLAAPLGNGWLYIDPKHIAKLWPLLADDERDTVNILRLNHLGTHPVYNTLGIKDAIDYLQDLGLSRKEERLRYLRLYWMEGLKDTPNVVFNTPWASERACAIGNVGLKNMAPAVMAQRLMDEYRIFTVAIDYANIKGCRITPNVFTTTAELDRFILAVKDLATS
ncbi:MAG: aminotransferase class V-fold PLP-dependent enzyme [Algoriphagus sp.]|jgi:selenocysteine lyase/cysteine desulfurase|nr:aminotransferase class V-fold PLP-dependent enzyme [Algoriphagus sp.]MDP4674647.1 aminotransferase class V-fold PLP-dependent enzyme [Flavobacteriaceae bacterium]MDP4755366.1 aminotransferase class V-fold PLP-dependent enzyme [Flavobacteriaceae bacterium]MDP4795189.1 aminotransferase class V-fold PLP-dependent enzyme [Flavobacteriaceae bacterium]MDP4885831.1 aminotransferase class V-fold PLP-dependent enzyme [Flavobacteriaceae bacterium]